MIDRRSFMVVWDACSTTPVLRGNTAEGGHHCEGWMWLGTALAAQPTLIPESRHRSHPQRKPY